MIALLLALLTGQAVAGTYAIREGQEVHLAVDREVGLVVQLPSPVHVVTPSRSAIVEPLGDPSQGVRLVQVTMPAGSKDMDVITFILADGQSVQAWVTPADNVDTYADLKWAKPKAAAGSFIERERALLMSMIRDDHHRREVLEDEIVYEQYPDIEFSLRRRFRDQGLTGYVFVLTNRTKKILEVNPAVLSVDVPNRAVLIQSDHEQLGPKGTKEAQTILRLVVREDAAQPAPAVGSELPFIRVPKKEKGR